MKFNIIVGNPPYQVMAAGDARGSDPIYHKFIDLGMAVSDRGTLIHPGRFLFREGRTPNAWNEKMLSHPHYRIVKYFPNSRDVFSTVDIRGGVAISFWNNKKSFKEIGNFTPYGWLENILNKVKDNQFQSFSKLVYARTVYSLTEKLYEDNPWAEGKQSKGHRLDLGTNVFTLFPKIFKDQPYDSDNVQVYGLVKQKRVVKNVKRNYIKVPDNFESYKVLIPSVNGSGKLGEAISHPFVGFPFMGHTETFLCLGKFTKENEAKACLKYIKSKFVRVILGSLKVTNHMSVETWSNVPLQDFTEKSDIDWSKSVQEIDEQLYKKYKLSPDEIRQIQEIARPME